MIKGKGVSSGIAIGTAFVMPSWDWDIPETMISETDLAAEFERLSEGIRSSKEELQELKQDICTLIGEQESSIFDAHMAILEDPVFMKEVQTLMGRSYRGAEAAVKEVMENFVNMFDLLDDDYMRERAADIKDVGYRLLKNLLGISDEALPPENTPYILVAKEITPTRFVQLDTCRLLGMATSTGSANSHTAIMGRALGIPYVAGIEDELGSISNGDLLILDGDNGHVYVNPDEKTVNMYNSYRHNLDERNRELRQIADLESITLDGRRVRLAANINSEKELETALQSGAEGVGLFRTEFLFMDRMTMPNEEEQFEIYRSIAVRLQGQPLVIRTLDIGGDKELDYMPLPSEDNPFLGYRAIRISLDRVDIFLSQLKAILRASCYGQISILYPMISSIDEVREANQLLEQAKAELRKEGLPFESNVQVGIMIEVPAAVAIADLLAQEVHFFSIGTNDLIQYLLAVDRMNEHIAHLYDPFHPAVIRCLLQTVEAAKRHHIHVNVCGEFAGTVEALPLWIGLGVDELSMSSNYLLPIKEKLRKSRWGGSQKLVQKLMTCRTSLEVKQVLQSFSPIYHGSSD